MSSSLAAEGIELKIGDTQPIFLRPSLRAAFYLERKYNGFAPLLGKLAEGSMGAITDILWANNKRECFSIFEGKPLAPIISSACEPMAHYVARLANAENSEPSKESDGPRMTFIDYHKRLYAIATGWLGWTPQEAWEATPAEILAAYEGHLDMLRAIHGGAKDETAHDRPEDAKRDRAGLLSLKGVGHAV